MKKAFALLVAVAFLGCFAFGAMAADNPLKAGEKKVHDEFTKMIPKDKMVTVDDLYKKWQEVIGGKSAAYLLDVRSHPEFDAFHIEGSSHIHSGHFYTIPGKIKDPNAEIWVFCRTQHRAGYVAGALYKFGYKNVYFVVKAKDGTSGGVVGWAKRGYPMVNYFFGYVDGKGMHYAKPPLKERKGKSYVREFTDQR